MKHFCCLLLASLTACGGGTSTVGVFAEDAGGAPPSVEADAGSVTEGGDAATPDAAPPRLHVTSVGVGEHHACALLSDGSIDCWGRNDRGQLGDGTKVQSTAPVSVKGLSAPATKLVLGNDYTCAVLSTGHLACWGANSNGKLGDGTTVDRPTPQNVAGLSSVTSASASAHACAILTSGALKCWGANSHGEIGDGTLVDSPQPAAVNGLSSGVKSVALGGGRSCALLTNGTVKCWGFNESGQVGDGTKLNRPTPVDVVSPSTGATDLSVGWLHTCVLAAGTVKCRGYNGWGALGDGSFDDDWSWSAGESSVTSLGTDAAAVNASLYHSCAIRASSSGVVCWGGNNWGQLGDGTQTNQSAPRPVNGLTAPVKSLGVGTNSNCALLASGEVKCWGANNYGQLGGASTEICDNGTVKCSTAPVTVMGLP